MKTKSELAKETLMALGARPKLIEATRRALLLAKPERQEEIDNMVRALAERSDVSEEDKLKALKKCVLTTLIEIQLDSSGAQP